MTGAAHSPPPRSSASRWSVRSSRFAISITGRDHGLRVSAPATRTATSPDQPNPQVQDETALARFPGVMRKKAEKAHTGIRTRLQQGTFLTPGTAPGQHGVNACGCSWSAFRADRGRHGFSPASAKPTQQERLARRGRRKVLSRQFEVVTSFVDGLGRATATWARRATPARIRSMAVSNDGTKIAGRPGGGQAAARPRPRRVGQRRRFGSFCSHSSSSNSRAT